MDSLTVMLMIKEVIANKFKVGRMYQYYVDITHINSPDSFYVRPIIYRHYLSKLEALGEPITKDSDIEEGSVIIYASDTLKRKARGKILSLEVTDIMKCKIFAIDEGLFETVIWNEQNMWFPLQQIEIPSLITHCKLSFSKLPSKKWNEVAIQAFRDCVAYTGVRITVQEMTPDTAVIEITDPPYIITNISNLRRLAH